MRIHIVFAHVALELCPKGLEIFPNQCSQVPKHNGEFWIENGEIVWVDDAFTDHYMENLVDEDFDEGRIKLKLDHQDDSNAEYIDD